MDWAVKTHQSKEECKTFRSVFLAFSTVAWPLHKDDTHSTNREVWSHGTLREQPFSDMRNRIVIHGMHNNCVWPSRPRFKKTARSAPFHLHILTWICVSRRNGVHFFRHVNFQKFSDWGVLHILSWKCASRHNGDHFFDISTSKRAPTLVCFVHFDLEMCFAPQRRPNVRHLNFQKWTETVSFLHFDFTCFAPQRSDIFHLSSGQMGPHPRL